jgi:LuxR family maltose regulon positive regulatory protein
LIQKKPELLPGLYSLATDWLTSNGYPDEAIVYALRAGNYNQAAELLKSRADLLWERGDHGNLRAWLAALPVESISSKPLLAIYHAYYLHAGGDQSEGDILLADADKHLGSLREVVESPSVDSSAGESALGSKRLLGRYELIRALIYTFSGNIPGMIDHANLALVYLPQEDMTFRSLAAITLGDAYSYSGDMAASYKARAEALQTCEAAGDYYYSIVAGLKLASTLKEQGELQRAIDLCQQKIHLADTLGYQQSGSVGCLMTLYGDVLAEMDDLEKAAEVAQNGIKIAAQSKNLSLIGYSYIYHMRVFFSQGDFIGAQDIFDQVTSLDQEFTIPAWLVNMMSNWQTRIALQNRETGAASRWLAGRSLDTSKIPETVDYLQLFNYILLARILTAQDKIEEAVNLLEHLEVLAKKAERNTSVIEILILQSLAHQSGGDISKSMIPLRRALSIAEPLGFIRIFVDEGKEMEQMLHNALSREIAPQYVSLLLRAFSGAEKSPTKSPLKSIPESGLVEPLSDREIEVLKLIAEGLTNQEIANRLYLSLNTVKVHTRNIYAKLGVNNRTQASIQARALGILPPPDW